MLRFLRPILILLVLLAAVGGGYYLYQTKFAKNENDQVLGIIQDLTSQPQFQAGINSINLETFQKTAELTTQQLEQLGQNSQVVKDHFSKIITENKSASDPENNTDQSLQEKAFEYGRYIYCQEVVKDYEANH